MAQRQLVDRIAAVVNDEAITQSEVETYLRPLYQELEKQYQGEELTRQLNEVRLKLLNQMIEDRLVYQSAKAQGIIIDDSEIDEMVEESKGRFPTESEFENFLAQQGSNLNALREQFRRQIAIRKLQDMEIRSRVVVSPQEIEDYYANRRSEFAEEEGIKVRSITVRKSEEAVAKGIVDEAARAKIDSVRKQVLDGEDFQKLAKQFSEDANAGEQGSMGWMKRGSLLPSIEEVLFSLPAGGISEVLETERGYHVFKVEEKRANRVPPFEEVRDKIRMILYQEEARNRFKEWMDQLKHRAYISIR